MRYRLRTLLMVLALGPPLIAGAWLADWGDVGAGLSVLFFLGFLILLSLALGTAVAFGADWVLDRVLTFVNRK